MRSAASRMLNEPIRLTSMIFLKASREGAVLVDGGDGVADAGAIHQHARRAMRLGRPRPAPPWRRLRCDVAADADAADFLGDAFAPSLLRSKQATLALLAAIRRSPRRGPSRRR